MAGMFGTFDLLNDDDFNGIEPHTRYLIDSLSTTDGAWAPSSDLSLGMDAADIFSPGSRQDAAAAGTATGGTAAAAAAATPMPASIQTIGTYIATQSPTSSQGHHFAAGSTVTVNLSALGIAGEQYFARTALDAWSRVANIHFVETTGTAQITLADDGGSAYTNTSWSGATLLTSASIHIDQSWYNSNGGAGGTTGIINSYGYQTYLHELGHALGLGHSGPYNGSGTYGTSNIYTNDSWQFSVMSYFDQSGYGGATATFISSAMQADIYAMQLLYGTPTGQTNNKFGYGATAGAEFNLAQSNAFTIYSSTGTADLDASQYSGAQTVNFNAGTFSSIKGLTNNIGLALNTSLTSYEGGSGNDTIILDGLNNDFVNGGGGTDTVYVTYNYGSGYTIAAGSTATNLVMVGATGTDTLQNVEFVHFANGTTVSTSSLVPTIVTVAQAIANYNANNNFPPQTIIDTGANVAGSLDTLQTLAAKGRIGSMTLTGSQLLSITAAQFNADQGALAFLESGTVAIQTTGYSASLAYSAIEYDYTNSSLTKQLITYKSGSPYGQVEYDFSGGVLTTEFITGFVGQLFKTVEYVYTSGSISSAFVSGYTTTGFSQIEYDYNNGTLTKDFITGYTGQPFTQVEQDLTNGVVTKVFFSGYSGKGYSLVEQDYPAGALTKQIISGFTAQPFTSIEQSYTAGALTNEIYLGYVGTGYSAVEHKFVAGTLASYTLDNTNGTHTSFLQSKGQAYTGLLNEMLYTNGLSGTLAYSAGFGADSISGFQTFAAHGVGQDLLDLFGSGFSSAGQALSAAVDDGLGNVVIAFNNPGHDTLTLLGISKSGLSASDFKIA